MRTVVDCVLKLRELRKSLIGKCNDVGVQGVQVDDGDGVVGDVDVVDDSDDESSDDSESDGSLVDQESDEESDAQDEKERVKTFAVHGCHVHLL